MNPTVDDSWDAWYMAYPATVIVFAFPCVIGFIIGVLFVIAGWITPDAFVQVATAGFDYVKYVAGLAGIVGSLWALRDYA
jgi:hypothetical protein